MRLTVAVVVEVVARPKDVHQSAQVPEGLPNQLLLRIPGSVRNQNDFNLIALFEW
jgi:hypothetical protein